eukprot:SAG31_NODE_1924_length_6902_cov_5.916066_10_plen_131_part_00
MYAPRNLGLIEKVSHCSPLAKGNDKCTDSCCCIAFVVFWVLNFGGSALAPNLAGTELSGCPCGRQGYFTLRTFMETRNGEKSKGMLRALLMRNTCGQLTPCPVCITVMLRVLVKRICVGRGPQSVLRYRL